MGLNVRLHYDLIRHIFYHLRSINIFLIKLHHTAESDCTQVVALICRHVMGVYIARSIN